MLFLLKRTVATSLAALTVLVMLGLGLRQIVPHPVPLDFTPTLAGTGVIICGVVLCSDGIIHGLSMLFFGEWYLRRYRELAGVFVRQSYLAMICGALMAGIGEELVFRGLSAAPLVVLPLAVVFGLLHHIRRELWPFTLWSIWEGLLFALALLWTGELLPTMVAHFLHDLIGFLMFRRVNRSGMIYKS